MLVGTKMEVVHGVKEVLVHLKNVIMQDILYIVGEIKKVVLVQINLSKLKS